jgi:pimeloyl-ACP methyl ester carboxylesterase
MRSRHPLFAATILALLVTVFCSASVTAAERLLLVHGHFGSSADWARSGIEQALVDGGWSNHGTLPGSRHASRGEQRIFYTVSLPGSAPLQVQASALADLIYALDLSADDQLLLVGHSAGGVVARLAMVQQPQIGVDTLITIAAPNLGAPLAGIGAELGHRIFAALPYLGGITEISELARLYQELGESGPGSLLAWLNQQPHPPARYVSVVRPLDPATASFDLMVPVWSQPLDSVPALAGRARVASVPGLHGLGPGDAAWLRRFLDEPGV